ncbi:MAG: FAD-binding oxidoreductase [Propionibacteriaceae bacterium]|nr:FAD-binding oxidoreductase [Propionibacteriaceae bacterium]
MVYSVQPVAISAQAGDLVRELRQRVRGEVSTTSLRRSQYASDASNYRLPPLAVVYPLDVDDLIVAAGAAREFGIPLTTRGGGTSVAGNAIGAGIVVDTSVHLNNILDIDPTARTARVQPGVILTDLQREAGKHGLRFGPDPSTQAWASIGGMIGNNACGPHAIAYGRTADNVVEMDVLDGHGKRFTAGNDLTDVAGLESLVLGNLGVIRTELGRFSRQVSGYSLEHLLPENGHNLTKALVGTEGTLVTVLEATLALVPVSPSPVLVLLGYQDMHMAADDVPQLAGHRPLAMEGMDARLIEVVRRRRGSSAVPEMPTGGGWLLIEVGGDNEQEALERAEALVADAAADTVRILPAGAEAAAIWRMRADGAGLAGRTARGSQAWPGWEDAAVPPEALGAYLREFDALMDTFGVVGVPYGHFGDGCVHVRVDIPLEKDGEQLRAFTTRAAELVIRYGGSLSGEHGDGRARSELLKLMYSPQAIRLFEGFKALFDPGNLLNPGVIVSPRPLDENLRRPLAHPIGTSAGFAFSEDEGDFTKAVHRCVGVGRCRGDNAGSGGFMCPSFRATSDETHVTRGRARVLQDLSAGAFGAHGWTANEVGQALDLCLGCKACVAECPAGVDMARYKSEVLHRRYRGKLRPASHYSLGKLPTWARLAGIAPWLVNALLSVPLISKVVLAVGGIDSRRSVPRFAAHPFQRSTAATTRRPATTESISDKPKVALWVDSFDNAFSPHVAQAAIAVLEHAGYQVLIPSRPACCGLTWITTGQLDVAKQRLRGLLDVYAPFAEAQIPIAGLEPSCTAVVRSDLVALLPDDPRSAKVAAATHTIAELLTGESPAGINGWTPPDLSDVTAIVQPHCHQKSVTGFDADLELLTKAGAKLTVLAGCCGLAGIFGMEKDHYETSVAVANDQLLPALATAEPGTLFLADGFSCRTQAKDLAGVTGLALVELIASRLLP